ncbi:MAG: 5-formyltetrahydrofolate cyclo-ligase [Alkalispirochaeta sp.]
MSDKTKVRRDIQGRLAALTPEERIVADAHIGTQITHLPYWDDAGIVAGYMAMDDEVDLQAVLRVASQAEKRVALPRIEDGEMTLREVVLFPAGLERHPLGFLQPAASAPVINRLSQALVLVPGRAFDRVGHRIGRGGGYYDRFLSNYPDALATIGVCYSVQFRHSVPSDSGDVPVQIVITESETCFCSRPYA